MRVLVATNELQGTRTGDYAWTVEGELVVVEMTGCADPRCGCTRGFSGLASSRATTTAMVVDLAHIGPHTLREVIGGYLERAGWNDLLPDDEVDEGVDGMIDEHIENLEAICSGYPIGTVIERDGTEVRPRGLAAAA
jgi:hypothetical protein